MERELKGEIISVGSELLLGQIANTDAQYVSQRLQGAGVGVYYHSVVGDNPTRIKEAIHAAQKRSNVIILTGGLGPTADDLTKEMLCEALGEECYLHEESARRIRAHFEKRGVEMPESNLKQAYFPRGARVLQNDNGTAPGMLFEKDGICYIIFPGPPSELLPMLDNYAMKELQGVTGNIITSRIIRMYGIGESQMEVYVKDILEKSLNPTVAPLIGDGDVTLRITARAESLEKAREMIAPVESELHTRLGEYIYGYDNDTLESVVVELLKRNNITLATAESCTGGDIARRITEVSGASGVFGYGFVTYANEAKRDILGVDEEILKNHGAVSEECARAMLKGLINRSGADIGVAVTGIAGPTGGSAEKPVGLVYIAFGDNEDVQCIRYVLKGNRARIRRSASMNALNNVRKFIINKYEGK